MTPFEKAFAAARAAGLKEFTFQGKQYNTMYKEEAEALARGRTPIQVNNPLDPLDPLRRLARWFKKI